MASAQQTAYEERYKDHIDASSSRDWIQYISKKVLGTKEDIDCGLYCEEFDECDFFIQYSNCYLGTFQKNVTEPVVVASRVRGEFYPVYKEGIKITLLKL